MKVTAEHITEYFDNIPAYRRQDEIDEVLGNFPLRQEIKDLKEEIEELEERIEELESTNGDLEDQIIDLQDQ